MPHNQDNAASLWQRLTEHNDPRARTELVERNRPLVGYLARRIFRRPPPGLTWEDLEGAGAIGLVWAVDHFDPSRGTRFSTYAGRCVSSQLLRAARSAERRAGPELLDGLAERLPDPDPTPSEVALGRALGDRLWPLVDCLPPNIAHVLRMRYREGAPWADIARERGEHASWVYKLHREGLDRLRELLEGDEILERD